MSKVPQVTDLENAGAARPKWNQAMKTVEHNSSLTGTGEVGSPLGVDDPYIQTLIDATIDAIPAVKSYTDIGRSGISGVDYVAGWYDAPATDANLTQASTTVNHGTANIAYESRVFVCCGGAGSTDGSDLVLTVSGTSYVNGVRTPADSEVIVADATLVNTDDYLQTSKKWLGQVTITLSSTGGTVFSFDFNYGFAKFDDVGEVNFRVVGFEFVGLANANDTGFDIEVLLHDGTGWTYHATAFVPGGTVLWQFTVDHGAESDIANGQYFNWDRSGLSQDIDGTSSEGFVFRITTGTNNAIAHMDAHMKFLYL